MQIDRNEHGIAMVTAILVSTIVVLLGLVAISLATHSTTASAQERSRTQAVHAAEAGINQVVSRIQKSAPETLATTCTVTGEVSSNLTSEYSTTVEYYKFYPFDVSDPSHKFDCATMTGGTVPRGAFVTSVGTVSDVYPARRTIQAQYRLNPILGGFNSAIFSHTDNGSVEFNNQFTLTGNQTFDGDVYTNGDFVCDGNVTIEGSVYAQGSAFIKGCEIKVDIWANGNVDIEGATFIREDAISSTGKVDVTRANKRCKPAAGGTDCAVGRNASAGTSCIDCKTVTNQGVKVRGEVLENNVIGPPPQEEFPKLSFDRGEWEANGFVVEFAGQFPPASEPDYTFTDCEDANRWIDDEFANWTVANHVVIRISGTCDLNFDNNATITMPKHLAIISDGGITMSQQTTFESSDSDPRNIYLIVPYYMHPDDDGDDGFVGTEQPCTGTQGDITIGNNTNFNNVRFSIYSPCTVTFANNNAGNEGQIYGGHVDISNQASMKYNPLLIPGAGEVSGFDIDPAFTREIVNDPSS